MGKLTINRILYLPMRWISHKYNQLVRTGTEGVQDEELVGRIRFVNMLCIYIGLLLLFIGPVVCNYLEWSAAILIPFVIEFILNWFVLVLNARKKYYQASVLLYYLQCSAIIYFGYQLGEQFHLHFMVMFLISIIYLVFRKGWERNISLIIAIAALIFLQVSYYVNYIKFNRPITMASPKDYIIQSLVIGGVLVLILFVSKRYVTSFDYNPVLRQISQFKKVFIYQVTHEVRTPLNAIYGVAQLLKREIKMDPSLKKIESLTDQLLAATNNAKSIVNNVLDMAQIESGHMESTEVDAFMVHTFFSNIVEVNRIIARAREIKIDLTIEKVPDVVISDTLKLNQITTNLVANAIKYAYKKTTIYLRVQRSENDMDKWTLQVINEGPGISPEKLPVIFDPFITDKNEKHIEATGLGLYIVKNKVDLMGGTVHVESEPSGYTVFTVTLPLMRGWLKDIRSNGEPDKEEIDISGTKVLLAEDEPLNAVMLTRFLENHGCFVTHVSDGQEVLEKVYRSGESFDIIIMDYHMPLLDGIETLKRLKNNELSKNTPVIIATGDAFKESQDLLLLTGADAVVEKPIEHKLLLEVLHWHLLRSRKDMVQA